MSPVEELPVPEATSDPATPAESKAATRPLPLGRPSGDRAFKGVMTLFGLTIPAVPAMIVPHVAHTSQLSLAKFGLSFLTSSKWDPVHLEFGAWPFIYGTLLSSLLALCIAAPLSS